MVSTTSTAGHPPWHERRLGYGLKILLTFGVALLLLIAIFTGFTLLALLASPLLNGPRPGDFEPAALAVYAGLLVACVGSIAGVVLLNPLVTAPAAFTPSYGAVAPDALGQPFEVHFQRAGRGRTMTAKGTLRFEPEALSIDGQLSPHLLAQLGVVVVLTLGPLITFGIGLGFIPALIIANYIGRERVELRVPYAELRDVRLKGSRLTLSWPGKPKAVALATALSDGERLYREVLARFPLAR